jgi:hypothetical protein
METKFKVLDLLSKVYSSNSSSKERREAEATLEDLGII